MSVVVSKADRGYLLETEQEFPLPRAELFPFFADAANLESITPAELRFRILTPLPITMARGALIDYRLRINGIPVRWRTEISTWDPPVRFVDRQLRGPYRWWIHEHEFIEIDGGTLMRDRVEYGVLGGAIVNRLLVQRQVERIFGYRRRILEKHFAAPA